MKKRRIYMLLIGLILLLFVNGISVYATAKYLASEISFVSTNPTFTANNVEDAINTLYDEAQQKKNYYKEEESIIGRWVDGKPLYRQVYFINTPGDSKEHLTPLKENNRNEIELKRMYGMVNGWLPLNTNIGGEWYVRCWLDSDGIKTVHTKTIGTSVDTVIIEYTKVSD